MSLDTLKASKIEIETRREKTYALVSRGFAARVLRFRVQ